MRPDDSRHRAFGTAGPADRGPGQHHRKQYARLRISAQPDEYYRGKCDCELNNAADTAAAFEMEAGSFPAADRHHQGAEKHMESKNLGAEGAAALHRRKRLRPDGRGGAERHGIVLHGLQGISGH